MNDTPNQPSDHVGLGKSIIAALGAKMIGILIAIGLFLVTAVVALAIWRGSVVNFWGLDITPPKNVADGQSVDDRQLSTNNNGAVLEKKIQVKLTIPVESIQITEDSEDEQLTVLGFFYEIDGTITQVQSFRWKVELGGIIVETELREEDVFVVVIKTPEGKKWETEQFRLTEAFMTPKPSSN